jgi:hypothetical protein
MAIQGEAGLLIWETGREAQLAIDVGQGDTGMPWGHVYFEMSGLKSDPPLVFCSKQIDLVLSDGKESFFVEGLGLAMGPTGTAVPYRFMITHKDLPGSRDEDRHLVTIGLVDEMGNKTCFNSNVEKGGFLVAVKTAR